MVTELVVWDWNGTLIDDTRCCYEIANDMRLSRGIPLFEDMEAYRRAFGFPVVEYYRRTGYTFETEGYEAVSREFVRLYAERLPSCSLTKGARETIAAIHARGVRQALLSATGETTLLSQVALFDLADGFERIMGMTDNFSAGKAARARAFFEEEALDPARVLMIGDTDHDHAIARELGCRCALLASGHQTPAYLRTLGAPLLTELPEVLALL